MDLYFRPGTVITPSLGTKPTRVGRSETQLITVLDRVARRMVEWS